jgi:hypothetical protein
MKMTEGGVIVYEFLKFSNGWKTRRGIAMTKDAGMSKPRNCPVCRILLRPVDLGALPSTCVLPVVGFGSIMNLNPHASGRISTTYFCRSRRPEI